MPYEEGGRADKSGNRFEIRIFIYYLLMVLEEKIDYVTLEALGDDEIGIDIWIGHKNGTKEGLQGKGRNGSQEFWDFGTANARDIFIKWKQQLDRDPLNIVSLASPLAFTLLEDLTKRAKSTNGTPSDFYNYQILNSGSKFISFFNHFCKVMGINPEIEPQLGLCINYLNRIEYHQFPDAELKPIILCRIGCLFLGSEEHIYNLFVAWIVDGEILGKQINQDILYEFINYNNIKSKNLALDNRIIPRISLLDSEYERIFQPLNTGMFDRDEFVSCREAIKSCKSLIIHGKAGRGKSGCTEDIIKFCKNEKIQYLAVKLDKRIPSCTAEKWGKDLGLPASIVHCIHSISKDGKAVIILDQLDALRWTQAHSRDALLVCSEIIQQVIQLNYERKYKISMVFVCRTYDLENDNNIKSLFESNSQEKENCQWGKIHIGELKDDKVKDIVGNRYLNLTNKLRELLRCPSNIYIWQHLDIRKEYSECVTTTHLVLEWWNQLTKNCFNLGISESKLNEVKDRLIDNLDKLGRICIPIRILASDKSSVEYLVSNGFLILQDNKVSFAHQSVLDCFLAEKMLNQYFSPMDLVDIIGSKEKQTPGKRYQLQMLMQSLIEIGSQDFLNAGQQLLNSELIRYSNKFVFFEVLNQLESIDDNIKNFIIENCENKPWSNNIITNVIYAKAHYYELLRDYGVIDRWFSDPEKKQMVFNLLGSIRPKYDHKNVAFIAEHIFKSEEDDNGFAQCFNSDIYEDSDELFELRLRFYKKYPRMMEHYVDFKSMVKRCELRAVRYFVLLLENKIKSKEYTHNEYDFLYAGVDFIIKNGEEVINLLLSYIPKNNDDMQEYSSWSGNTKSFERVCVTIIKKANASIIASNPFLFWNYYYEFMGKGNYVYNELILDALYEMPKSFSDFIVSYLYSDIEKNIFDKTSGNGDMLLLAKKVLSNHALYCSQAVFDKLENKIIHYLSPHAKELYKQRIECKAYFSFWGDLQYELLNVLPITRLSNEARNLLNVLKRKFANESTLYKHTSGHGGWVSSPVAKKKLTNKNWLTIITNKKIKSNRIHSRWKEVPGGFLESSIEMFSENFSSQVSTNPEEMIELILSQSETIENKYVDALFSGLANSSLLNSVSTKLIEQVILRYPCDHHSYRAGNICTIIREKDEANWSQEILNILLDVAVNHEDPEKDKPKEMYGPAMLFTNAIKCVRGNAARAMGSLLSIEPKYLKQFKEPIEHLILDENSAVRLSVLFVLWPAFNIDRKWASEKILMLFEQDHRLAVFSGTRNMLFLLYAEYHERVLSIIKKCYNSEDEELVKIGANCLAEMYICKNEFGDEINDVEAMSKTQAEGILHMATIYFNRDEYNNLAKEIICKFKTSKLDLSMSVSRLFYDKLIKLERDKDFLLALMDSDLNRRISLPFEHYLEEESISLFEYKDIIINLSNNIIENIMSGGAESYEINESIPKLVIGLYDEVSGSTQPLYKEVASQCLDLWDRMFEKQIGYARILSQRMMER